MVWVVVGVMIWVALALPVAVLIGRAIRLADQRRPPGIRLEVDGRAPVTRPRSPVVRSPVRGAERKPPARKSGVG